MVSQVAGDGIGGGRQQAFPLYFKMAYGRSVAAARVVALGSFNILGETGHVTVVKACFFERSEGKDTGHHSKRRRRFSARVHDLGYIWNVWSAAHLVMAFFESRQEYPNK